MKKPILCVYEEKVILDRIRELYGKYGNQYIYESAQSADVAWEILFEFEDNKNDFLLIFSEWLMPRVKGDEFLIKVHEKFDNVTKVLLTGQADNESILKANLYKWMTKPWNQTELFERVEFALGK